MKASSFLIFLLWVTASCFVFAQHVTDDTVYYTAIPLPSISIKNSKSHLKKDTTKTRLYFFSVQSGYLFGCKGCDGDKAASSTFSVINGVKAGAKGRIGIGVSYDSYWGYQVLPVYASVSWDLLGNRNKNAFFIQMNYGHSLAWYQSSLHSYGYDQSKGGRMIAPQFGYRIKYHDMNISFLAGIKMQRVFSYFQYPTWQWVGGEYVEGYSSYTVKQDMTRVSIGLSIGWR